MPDPAARQALLDRLVHALREDGRITAAILVGSGATGFLDEDSDLDVLAAVDDSSDAAAVYQDWRHRLPEHLPLVYLAWPPGPFQLAHRLHNAILDAAGSLLEVDLSFTPFQNLRATRPDWLVLFDRSAGVPETRPPRAAHAAPDTNLAHQRLSLPLPDPPPLEESLPLFNAACHRVLECRKALRRGRLWHAALVLHELRDYTLQLALLARATDEERRTGYQRRVDDLPPTLLTALSRTITPVRPDRLKSALHAATRLMLQEAGAFYARLNEPFPDRFAHALLAHLD